MRQRFEGFHYLKSMVPGQLKGPWSLILKICPLSLCDYIFIITDKSVTDEMQISETEH